MIIEDLLRVILIFGGLIFTILSFLVIFSGDGLAGRLAACGSLRELAGRRELAGLRPAGRSLIC